jgi:hypothetical protein
MEHEMSDNSVVVNLNQFERARRSQLTAESLALLHACRDQLIEGTARGLTRHTEAMENALLAMAERSPLLNERNIYYSAQSVLNKQANELLSACKDAYCTSFDSFVQGRERGASADLSELSLLGDQDFEITLAIDKAAARMRYNCAEELVALEARITKLMGRELTESDNPLGPRKLCEALLDGISRNPLLETPARLAMLHQFDLVLTTELGAIYQSINRHLVDRGILPDLKAGTRARARGTATDGGTGGAASPASAAAAPAGSDMLRLFEQLAGGAAGAGMGMGAGSAGTAAAGGPGFSLVDSLAQLQNGPLMLPGIGSFELPMLEAASIRNVLRTLQQSPVMRAASPLDAVLVDAVAMLFDVVFDEAAIPDRLKAQIARLQIPVLKAAMLDREFFSQARHPVRRMLDAIARLAVHLPDTDAGSAHLETVTAVVSRVIDTFDKDLEIFRTAADELEAMCDTLDDAVETTAKASLQPDIDQIRQAERAEFAPVVAHDLVNRALQDQEVPDTVREFLRRDWARLLGIDYVREGEQGAHFNSHVETMRELVWSVQSKPDMDARLMLVRILPGLLKRLREGVAELDLPQKLAENFFATLVILHANAVRPNAQPVPLPEIPAEEMAALLAEPVIEAPAAPVIDATAEPVVEDEFTERAHALNKGDWVEFHYEDGTFRWARLGWVSHVRNTYLFADQDGLNSFSISLNRLADKLRRHEAVVVERRSITESALGKLMKALRQKIGG